MPSRVPLTNLTDRNKGGAPLYLGGDRHPGENVPTPPDFIDDEDQYLSNVPSRRGLLSIAHIPPSGGNTVDFVNLYLRNNSTTTRKYVNVFLSADISAQMRVSSLQTSYPVFADMLVVEDNSDAVLSSSINAQNEIEIEVVQNAQFTPGLIPSISFDPPPSSNLSATVTLTSSGAIESVSVLNPTAHSYTSPPQVSINGGVYRELGFYQQTDEDTIIYGSSTAGSLTMIGNLGRTQFSHNVSSVGDVMIVNNELRVVTSTNSETREINVDKPFSTSNATFDQWAYVPYLSASNTSILRIGAGTISNQVSLGFNGVICSSSHGLFSGDYIIYNLNGTFYSHRVVNVVNDFEFTTDSNVALTSTSATSWNYVYYLSETQPGADSINPVKVVTYTKTSYSKGNSVNVFGIGGRNIFLRNKNYFNEPGSYYNESFTDEYNIVLFCNVSNKHNERQETVNTIQPFHTLEVTLKPQPAPEVQVLAGFPMNGGLATEVGKRPILALNERACASESTDVVYWGYYVRYQPDSATNYTQAINV